jgi:hypothetical protein
LAPPRSRPSVPARAQAEASAGETAAPIGEPAPISVDSAEDRPAGDAGPEKAAEVDAEPLAAAPAASPLAAAVEASIEAAAPSDDATTPTEPTTESEAPPPAPAMRATEVRVSEAPPSKSDDAARSLIPVATSAETDASEETDNVEDDFELPGATPPWSGAAVRRVTFVALLAAAAAVPAWVVFRARTVDVQARTEVAASKAAPAGVGPTTLQPPREIEADDDTDEAEPPPAAVPVDPVKALQVRREARRLLESGQIDPGVAAARNAIALDPADPECYVLLAAGLQDHGRWAESREVFSRCVNKSKNGINAECVYFASSGTITNR